MDSHNSKPDSSLLKEQQVCTGIKNYIWFDIVFNAIFSNIMATSFSSGRNRSTRREPLTMGKQLVYFYHLRLRVECTFLEFTKPGANPRLIGDRSLTHWATRPLQLMLEPGVVNSVTTRFHVYNHFEHSWWISDFRQLIGGICPISVLFHPIA
jgi:hypothetical protein